MQRSWSKIRKRCKNLKRLSQALEAKKEVEAVNHTLKSEKMDLKGNQSVLIAENEELKSRARTPKSTRML